MGMTKLENFVFRCSPIYWLMTAEELKSSCDALVKDFMEEKGFTLSIYNEPLEDCKLVDKNMISKGYFLLAGFTIENLLKGILIFQNPSYINKGKLSKEVKTHNLIKIYSQLKQFELDPEKIILIEKLSNAIPYWGRYPAPLIAEHLLVEDYIDMKVIQLFESTYRELHLKLVQELRKGWESGLPDKIGNIQNVEWETFE
jgi:hypothetical protein